MSINFRAILNILKFPKTQVLLLASLLFLMSAELGAQGLYIKTFGKPDAKPIIFLHGGPGYNCASFERTTAQELSQVGFYVITYDRRGEGRSAKNAEYSFDESHDDLMKIMDSLEISSAHFIGHSFGGIQALKFAEQFPERVQSISLVGAPISLQASFKTILNACEKIYTDKKDKTNLAYIKMLRDMDTSSIQYSSFCFMHAMQCGFYTCKNPNPQATKIYKSFGSDSILMKYASKMGRQAPEGFWKNEAYTTLDLEPILLDLKSQGISIFGIYGKEDGLYSKDQIDKLSGNIGKDNLLYLSNCSHSVFIDQQLLFIEALENWLK